MGHLLMPTATTAGVLSTPTALDAPRFEILTVYPMDVNHRGYHGATVTHRTIFANAMPSVKMAKLKNVLTCYHDNGDHWLTNHKRKPNWLPSESVSPEGFPLMILTEQVTQPYNNLSKVQHVSEADQKKEPWHA